MPSKSPGPVGLNAARSGKRTSRADIDGKILEWMIFGGIYLALAIFAAAVGGPADPGGLGLSP